MSPFSVIMAYILLIEITGDPFTSHLGGELVDEWMLENEGLSP